MLCMSSHAQSDHGELRNSYVRVGGGGVGGMSTIAVRGFGILFVFKVQHCQNTLFLSVLQYCRTDYLTCVLSSGLPEIFTITNQISHSRVESPGPSHVSVYLECFVGKSSHQ